MRRVRNLRLFLGGSVVAAVPLLLAGCGQADNATTSEETTASTTVATDTGAAATDPVVDETSAPDTADVVAVPTPTATTDSSEAAPLTDAAAIASAISIGQGIERIRHGDGWAWMRDGRIIRTASADGRRVAYFRNGSEDPFLVQDGNRAYAYSGRNVSRTYDRGRPAKVDSHDRDTADKLAGQARNDRNDARHVADNNPRPSHRPTPSSPSDHPSRDGQSDHPAHGPDAGQSTGHSGHDTTPNSGHDNGQDTGHTSAHGSGHGQAPSMRDSHGSHGATRPTPAPTPTPTPTDTHRGDRERQRSEHKPSG